MLRGGDHAWVKENRPTSTAHSLQRLASALAWRGCAVSQERTQAWEASSGLPLPSFMPVSTAVTVAPGGGVANAGSSWAARAG
jgi:hypothetical protein